MDEDCGICGLPLTDKYSYKISCNHMFHYECLTKTFSKICGVGLKILNS